MRNIFSFAPVAAVLLAVSATAACADESEDFETSPYALSVPADTVLGIPVDGNFSSISNSFEVLEEGKELLEGDPYDFMIVTIADDLNVKIAFSDDTTDENSHVHYFEIHSALLRDPRGLTVGSALGRVMDAWPEGRFVAGFTDGKKYARYWTGHEIIFSFDPGDLEESCFQSDVKCEPSRDIDVESIFVYPGLEASS